MKKYGYQVKELSFLKEVDSVILQQFFKSLETSHNNLFQE